MPPLPFRCRAHPPATELRQSAHRRQVGEVKLQRFIVLILAAVAFVICARPAAAQEYCVATPDSLSFGASGGTANFWIENETNGSCIPPIIDCEGVNPPGSGCPATAVLQQSSCYDDPNGNTHCEFIATDYGNTNCSSETGILSFLSEYSPVTVTTAGAGGLSCAIQNQVPNGVGPTGTPTNPQSCCGDPISTGTGNFTAMVNRDGINLSARAPRTE